MCVGCLLHASQLRLSAVWGNRSELQHNTLTLLTLRMHGGILLLSAGPVSCWLHLRWQMLVILCPCDPLCRCLMDCFVWRTLTHTQLMKGLYLIHRILYSYPVLLLLSCIFNFWLLSTAHYTAPFTAVFIQKAFVGPTRSLSHLSGSFFSGVLYRK